MTFKYNYERNENKTQKHRQVDLNVGRVLKNGDVINK